MLGLYVSAHIFCINAIIGGLASTLFARWVKLSLKDWLFRVINSDTTWAEEEVVKLVLFSMGLLEAAPFFQCESDMDAPLLLNRRASHAIDDHEYLSYPTKMCLSTNTEEQARIIIEVMSICLRRNWQTDFHCRTGRLCNSNTEGQFAEPPLPTTEDRLHTLSSSSSACPFLDQDAAEAAYILRF